MRLPSLVALLAVVALGLGCTKTNPHYCPDGGYNDKDCTKPKHDAGPGDTGHVSEVGDANGANDATDVSGDLSTDAGDAAEAKPVCSDDDGCKGADAGTPACETRDGGARCVECTMNKHCGSTKPICDTTTDTCVECNGVDPTAECKDSSKSACDKAHHVCVQCVDDKTCGGTTPVCDVSTNKCRPCAADSECKDIAPGVCVDWDGHCATPTEVVTLNSSPTCVLSGQADFKFCKSIDAATALSVIPPRPVLLIQGANPVAALDLAGAVVIAPKVLIVGQGGATVGAGSGDPAGVRVGSAAKFWIRDLAISGGTVGVVAESSPELHLTRCVITHNDKGGIRTTNAGFDITNTIVAANGVGSDIGGVTFGGVRLGNLPVSGSGRFENNTVVDNGGPGVSCSGTYSIVNSIVHGNTTAQVAGCATTAPCCGSTDPDPSLDAKYHLMSGSPCIDKITATTSTLTVDIDQQPRPTPPTTAKLDCGADELVP